MICIVYAFEEYGLELNNEVGQSFEVGKKAKPNLFKVSFPMVKIFWKR